jgi:osmoprotectant transport system substrate-binding protein
MRLTRMLALGASVLVLVLSACSAGGGSTPTPGSTGTANSTPAASGAGAAKPTIKIGSDGFYEAKLMAEIYAQALEANGYTVDRSGIGMGARAVSAPALSSGQIDLKPEYIGSGLAFYAKTDPSCGGASGSASGSAAGSAAAMPADCVPSGDAQTNMTNLQNLLKNVGGGITVLNFTPAVDTNAFVVRPDTASQYNLSKMSDTAAVQDKIKWGLATDCATNPLCGAPGGALQTAYGITPTTIQNATKLSACDQPMVDALSKKTIDIGELCSTQPDIAQNGWVLLQDDKHTQPADDIAPLVRDDYLAKVDAASFEQILNDVDAKMDTNTLTGLNAKINFDKEDVAAVAKAWLQANGFEH